MIFRQFRLERGITLVELLATISLFAVVILLASTVIFQVLGNNTVTSEHIDRNQRVNVIVSELRSQFLEGNSQLCSTQLDEKYYIEVRNENGAVVENCIQDVDSSSPLSIKISSTITDFSLETTFTSKNSYVLDISIDNEEGVDVADCIFTNPTFIADSPSGFIKFKKNICKDDIYLVNGDANIKGNLSLYNSVHFIISDDLYVYDPTKTLELKNGSILQVDGNAHFDSEITLKNNSQLIVENDAHFYKEFSQQGNSGKICVKGNTIFHNGLKEEDFTHILGCN
ncbi:hypothetical protein GMD78_00340 [Ornithinibacillus sp. L9]|uniref:Prepilin-type N-terminal cleavage/methylation domain-containing protein n=1 Tax=Ornithinibacillus caprae TaxID=2678566 RepID=A0A6N8FGJ4_9BACI|nr:type II secretion system protein [Ornithinibacillus caprae]MUK86849.1 hypothetical protein [Ornithinibacillus caprae]